MSEKPKLVRAGIGIMVMKDRKVLLGRRHSDPEKADSLLHGEGQWTLPGGKLDFGDTIPGGAAREVKEETNIDVKELEAFCVTNERVHDAHFVTVGLIAREFEGEPKVMEPDEIVEWKWFSLDELPSPIFLPSEKMIKNYKDKAVYKH
ncbi:MAG: NUDIX domain-containing protein [Candidatus Aenigmarchaeota archaeon]